MSRSRAKSAFFGAVKLHCQSLQNNFFPKFFGHSVSPGCSKILKDGAFTKKIDYFTIFWGILNLEEHPSHNTGSSVTAILLNAWILPICSNNLSNF